MLPGNIAGIISHPNFLFCQNIVKFKSDLKQFLKSGATWRDIPERYGSWKTSYSRYRSWVDAGLFERIFKDLIDEPDMENISLDSTSIRAHQKATGAKKTPAVTLRIKPSV